MMSMCGPSVFSRIVEMYSYYTTGWVTPLVLPQAVLLWQKGKMRQLVPTVQGLEAPSPSRNSRSMCQKVATRKKFQ
jgi:hypothetical protein